MPPLPDDPLQSPQDSDAESAPNQPRPKSLPQKSRLTSEATLPYRRSNASLTSLYASTSSLSGTQVDVRSPSESGTVTPPTTAAATNGSVFSPPGSTLRSPSPASSARLQSGDSGHETRDLILRAFCPHVSVLASPDTEELVRHKGIHGGLLDLLRPFGEHVPGKVTIRDSVGASRSWEDFAVRFVGVKDGLEGPRLANRRSVDSAGGDRNGQRTPSMLEFKPARLRTGGDAPQVEELVERHLTFAEEQSGPVDADYLTHKDIASDGPGETSPFYLLYLRRLLSGLPLVPSETLSHPVASVIAISSRSPTPIEELRGLYAASNTGEARLPQWTYNEFLRYYLLIHDEDYDDIQQSMQLYEQMKRHFGLHCHLLRLRSTLCPPEATDTVRLPHVAGLAAAEELAEIVRRESSEDDIDEDPTPSIYKSDAVGIRAFVREMVTQSVIPSMERASATWNDQVASRRRGLSGRFMSLSKRFTAFGNSGSNRNSASSMLGGGSGGNYDNLQGFYRPDAPEAIMRRLADYALMLRDWKLAQSTFEMLTADYKNDKAWRHYAGANEMAAASSLIPLSGQGAKVRIEAIDQFLETAYYSYITRCQAPYNALRTLILGIELLKMRGGSVALDAATRWSARLLDDRLVGPVGHALLLERTAECYSKRRGRARKAAFCDTLACEAWLRLEKATRAEVCLKAATKSYNEQLEGSLQFEGMTAHLAFLRQEVQTHRSGPRHLSVAEAQEAEAGDEVVETLQGSQEVMPRRPSGGIGHRKSVSTSAQSAVAVPPVPALDPLGAVEAVYESAPLSPRGQDAAPMSPLAGERREGDGFE